MNNKKYFALSVLLLVFVVLGVARVTSAQGFGQGRGQEGFRGGQRGKIMGNNRGIVGTVSAVNGTSLTVVSKLRADFGKDNEKNGEDNNANDAKSNNSASLTYTVDASTATVTKNGASSSVSAITVGDTVQIQGTITGTNIVAKIIRNGMMSPKQPANQPLIQGNGLPVIAGIVNAISGNSLTVANKSITYTVDVTSATIIKNGQTSTVSGITVGDNVVVQGTVNGNNISATSVIDQAKQAGVSGNAMPKKNAGFFGGVMNFFRGIFGF